MAYVANKIHEHLYQGGLPPGGDLLSIQGIDVLVLCAKEWQDASQYEGVTVILAPGDDDDRPHRLKNFLPMWKKAATQVAEHVKAGHTVLVTCMAGLNRSGVVTAMAMHELTGWDGIAIVEHIQKQRDGALCNNTFARYIIEVYPSKEIT